MIDRQSECQTKVIWTVRQSDSQIDRQSECQTKVTWTVRQSDSQIDRQSECQTKSYGQLDNQTVRQI